MRSGAGLHTHHSSLITHHSVCYRPRRMKELLRGLLLGACALPVIGTLLSLSRGSHWIFRMWDFPRVQIAALAAASAVAYRTRFSRGTRAERTLLAADAAV